MAEAGSGTAEKPVAAAEEEEEEAVGAFSAAALCRVAPAAPVAEIAARDRLRSICCLLRHTTHIYRVFEYSIEPSHSSVKLQFKWNLKGALEANELSQKAQLGKTLFPT